MATGQETSAPRLEAGYLKQKRARGQLSCTPCRVGKLKCNRLRDPACDQCLKRGRETACQYVPPPSKSKPPNDVKGRIRQLESLVKELMVKQNQQSISDHPTPPLDADGPRQPWADQSKLDTNVEASLGKLDIGRREVAYTEENHWQTILSSLSDIQKDLGDDDGAAQDDAFEDTSETQVPDTSFKPTSPEFLSSSPSNFILGNTKAMTREELIKMVPDRGTADRLLSLWFNSPDPFKILIHTPTFQEEYKRFWEDQTVPTMWLGLLFAILCLAESFGLRNSPPSSPSLNACMERVRLYQSLTASAAVLADYTKPKEYTIECLLLYMVGLRSDNAAMNAWIVMGVVVRLALRMGYHRDPGHYPKITPFQAEMRRRVWSITNTIDVLMSFQLGLPSMVRTVASDTKPPENLLDRDFVRSQGFLPRGRGDHELTLSLYIQAKLRIVHVFSQAVELSHATVPPSFDSIQNLATDLERAKADLPLVLQMPSMSELVTDPAEQLMYRFNIDLLYLKCKIVLFRRYMLVPLGELVGPEQQKGACAGREACINSARRVLDHHHTIYNAIQPGGQLENMRWYMSSIAVHDFLLAAMVICLELSQQLNKDKNGMQSATRQAMMTALERSHDIWTKTSYEVFSTIHTDQASGYKGGDMYVDTEKARKAMAIMLARVKAQGSIMAGTNAVQASTTRSSVFDENGHSYFRNIGLTPESARRYRDNGDEGIYGVLTVHDWKGVPDDFQFDTTPRATVYGASSSQTPQFEDLLQGGDDPLWSGSVASQVDFDIGDPMSLDWQAWDNTIFNIAGPEERWPAQQGYDTQVLDTRKPAIQTFHAGVLPNTSGMHFSIEDMENVDLGGGYFFNSFEENEERSTQTRTPR